MFNPEIPDVPSHLFHQSHQNRETLKTDRYRIDLTTSAGRWENWVVKLEFNKLGEGKHGNGFYINIPNSKHDVILTAGHNLVDAPNHFCTQIRIITPLAEIPVSNNNLRVCERYKVEPNENNAIYDYGVILLDRDRKAPRRGFGFNLMLGLAASREGRKEGDVLQNRALSVSGYKPQDSPQNSKPTNLPRRAEGSCVKANSYQLMYSAKTEEGMSGGPVWLGFRGVETVVAVHNYGAEDSGEGNRGSRLNLDLLTTIFGFDDLKLGWTNVSLQYLGSPAYSMHLHLYSPSSTAPGKIAPEGRVRVGKPGRLETWFDVLPVSAPPDEKDSEGCYAFRLHDVEPARWLGWDANGRKVTLVSRFDARCEVKLLHVVIQPGKPFAIRAQLKANEWVEVRMGMALLDENDLEALEADPESYEDTSEILFEPISKEKVGLWFFRLL
ncbi:uncharacterized protein KY384_002759 [Bacidia gigantensis]|uniref:uncharacterized protein n=1 Tax=Bacidia gigantensis TaxID=2732470 RepID=UPI001D04FE4C|nr:uncharacterized protein KY384_002759 [Bacidia gigantensis]KAG8532881.1 hypothetical protein KY384_002759 [Bacidia gigantensis]